jgi:hypothetical protein
MAADSAKPAQAKPKLNLPVGAGYDLRFDYDIPCSVASLVVS